MPQREVVKVIGDVIADELGLRKTGPKSQIMLTNERFNIPPTNDLYVALSYIDAKPIGNNNYFDGATLIETQQVSMLYHVQIDIMSFDASARQRKEEIYQALRSIRAQQAMEENNIQIARLPSPLLDASSLEETKMLNRFIITIAVTALLTKVKAVTEYYDTFPTPEVTVNA